MFLPPNKAKKKEEKKKKDGIHSPRRGIEPRSPAWQAGILTTILPRMLTTKINEVLIQIFFSNIESICLKLPFYIFRKICYRSTNNQDIQLDKVLHPPENQSKK